MTKAERCVALLAILIERPRGVSVHRLYRVRGWGWRSAYRDLDTIERVMPMERLGGGRYRLCR